MVIDNGVVFPTSKRHPKLGFNCNSKEEKCNNSVEIKGTISSSPKCILQGIASRKMKFYLPTLLLVPVCLAKDYRFDSSASAEGDGSNSSPFKDLNAIQDLNLQPGDNILLKRGSSFTSPLVLNQSGALGSPITIQAYRDKQ